MSLLVIALTMFSFQILNAKNGDVLVKDSVSMLAGYANEVYYSLADGEVISVPRAQWDIAFRTFTRSSSIMINEGTGVKLYTYPKSDTTGWATVDTVGISGWTPMYNSFDDWENGAFSRNATSHPDYGWAIYNTATHDLVADSLFVIKLRDGSFRKLWMARKYSSLNLYSFRFANLDGSNESQITVDCNPYTTKNFVGYSIQTSAIVDFEPAKNSWDLLFTKYQALIPPNATPYTVTGVITNDGIKTIEYRHVEPDFMDWDLALASSSRSEIGYDWKTLVGSSYVVEDSLVYFVQDLTGNINKLIFTKFEGSISGKIVFEKTMISANDISENTSKNDMSIYPNPVKDKLNISLDNMTSFPVHINLSALTGQVVHALTIAKNTGNAISISVNDMPDGMYLLTAKSATGTSTKKVVVNK